MFPGFGSLLYIGTGNPWFIGEENSTEIDGYDYGDAYQKIRDAMDERDRYIARHGGRSTDIGKYEQRIQELKLDKLHDDLIIEKNHRQWGRVNTIQQEIDRVSAVRYR